jgi:drug efflux transport system ATP-binding protein
MRNVVIEHLVKTYDKGALLALNDVSFTVNEGELFGLIGPDGAGKTSIFRILTTLLVADKGTASVAGFDVIKDYKQIRQIVGYMPGRFSLYQDLTVEENLEFFATVFGIRVRDNYELIKDIYEQIKPFSNRRAGKLSGGMKQKLALCCAMIHKPQVLFLDEPTTGVDAVSRKEFWDMLNKLKQQGITILVSTPYMDEATLCERIALIQQGKILSVDKPNYIIQSFPRKLYAARSSKIYQLLIDFRNDKDVDSCFAFGEWLHITLKNETKNAVDLKAYASSRGHPDCEIKEIKPGIEDSFIGLMRERNIDPQKSVA